jgi:hypothetical protein
MTPWAILADHLRSLDPGVSVYETPTEHLDAPCYVVVPGEPWIDPRGSHPSFGRDEERYEVWAIAKSAAGWASTPLVHSMLHAVRHNLPEGWFFESAGQIGDITHQGVTYFGAPVRVTYNNCDNGDTAS